jgi:hypothetical protein
MPARSLDVLLVGAIALVLLVPLARRLAARRFDPFDPFSLFVLAYGVMFVARPAAMLLDNSLVFVGPLSTLDVSGHFTQMLVIALVGVISFSAGYWAPGGKQLASLRGDRRSNLDDGRLVTFALLLALLGLLAFVGVVAFSGGLDRFTEVFKSGGRGLTGTVETYRYIWLTFFVLIPASVALLGLGIERRRRAPIACSLILTGLVLIYAIPVGNRTALLPLIGGALVLYYLQLGRRPSLWLLATLAVVALFFSAFLSDVRARDTRGENLAQTIVRASKPSRVLQPLTSGSDSEMAPALAAALSVIPERLHYRYGGVILEELVVRPIPRSLWSRKPLPPRRELIATLWPVEYARGTLRPEFSALLYFYWDFGLIGVVAGMLAYGTGARFMYEYYRHRTDSLQVRVLYALSLWFVVLALRNDPVDTLMWAAVIVLPAWVIFRLAGAPAKASSPAPVSEGASSSA